MLEISPTKMTKRVNDFQKSGRDYFSGNKVWAKCFVSGTLILIEHGHKPIESIQIGKKVLARNENSNVQSYEKVVRLFVSETSELVRIMIGNEMIETIEEHPLYLPNKGWINPK
ncbi:Hint domain-containing protein [Enterococcus sp. AZ126]|uniref:Hint domain-containing protein n=1 Tax=Enterococcus sp. AZ126 TaxID=2774635 RepID=UPI003F23EED3